MLTPAEGSPEEGKEASVGRLKRGEVEVGSQAF